MLIAYYPAGPCEPRVNMSHMGDHGTTANVVTEYGYTTEVRFSAQTRVFLHHGQIWTGAEPSCSASQSLHSLN
jgi:hypothetical protein